jgi:hypothetical protein
MVHHIEGCTKVNVEEVDVAAFELCVFNSVHHCPELPGCPFLCSKAFLGRGEDVVVFYIVRKSNGNKACPGLGESVSHGDGPIVREMFTGALFVEETGVAGRPAFWSVVVVPEADEVQMEEFMKLVWGPFQGLV